MHSLYCKPVLCVFLGLLFVKDGAKEEGQVGCGRGPLAVVQGVDKDKLRLV